MTTRSQQLAARVIHKIQHVVNANYKDAYSNWCMKAPILILNDGLLQTLAFIASKSDAGERASNEERAAHHFLWDFARVIGIVDDNGPHGDVTPIIDGLRTRPMDEYLATTARGLKIAGWFKRLAESMLGATRQ